MRILFLLTQDLESPLGTGRMWPLAKELSRRGHQVRVAALSSRWTELSDRRFEREGVLVEYVGPMHVRKVGNQKLYYSTLGLLGVTMRASMAMARAALSESVDIIQVLKPHPQNSIAGLLAKWFKGGILCVDCDDFEAASNRFGAGWQRKVVAVFERYVPRFAKVVTTHTQFMRDKLEGWGCPPGRIHFLSNGVDKELFTAPRQDDIDALRRKLNLEEKQVVAYLGTLSLANHPVNLLIEAFALLVNQAPNTVLLLVGGGDDFERLKVMADRSGISRSVIFIGRVLPAEVPLYYSLANVSVEPVYDDDAARGRLPMKMFESWAMGIPFVTSPVGEREKIAGFPPASLLARPAGDPMALAQAILTILGSPDLAKDLRQRGLERVKSFTWDLLAEQMEKVYQEALLGQHD